MPELTRPDGAVIHYEVKGRGEPVLCLAPGGVSSEIGQWAGYLFDPLRALAEQFTVIAMDQRYAGASVSPFTAFSYHQMLDDQLAVLDAAGAARAHVIGADFGAAHALRLGYDAPARVASVTLLEPVGLDGNNAIGDYYARFNDTIRLARAEGLDAVLDAAQQNARFDQNPPAGPWAQRLHDDAGFREAVRRLGRETYITMVVDFRDGMIPWGRRYFAVSDPTVGRMQPPLLVLPGSDALHPKGVGEGIAEAAAHATLLDNERGIAEATRAFLLDRRSR